jgi:hypothetical protein
MFAKSGDLTAVAASIWFKMEMAVWVAVLGVLLSDIAFILNI